jgi:hypothetical protein
VARSLRRCAPPCAAARRRARPQRPPMGAACSACAGGGRTARVAPEDAKEPGARGLPAALAAARAAVAQRGGAARVPAQQAASLLDGLLAALLAASGLGSGGGGSNGSVGAAPAAAAVTSVPQLLARLRAGCARAGFGSLEPVAAAIAPLARRLVECGAQARPLLPGAGTHAVAAAAVPAADWLLSWLHALLYQEVSLETAASARRKHADYCALRDVLGWSDASLAACVGPAGKVRAPAVGPACNASAAAQSTRSCVLSLRHQGAGGGAAGGQGPRGGRRRRRDEAGSDRAAGARLLGRFRRRVSSGRRAARPSRAGRMAEHVW